MFKYGVLLICTVFMLQGCGETKVSAKKDVGSDDSIIEPSSYFKFNAVGLDDDGDLKFDGRVVRYDLIRNQRGQFDRFIIESPLSQMGLEGAVFAELAKKGYVRKIRKDEAKRYVVNYVAKGRTALSADYRPLKKEGAESRLVITRRTLE